MESVALDTTFLIDLQRERASARVDRGATRFLQTNPATELLLPVVALGEYLEGFDDPESEQASALPRCLKMLNMTPAVAALYARESRRLRAAGSLIGANDLWIGCIAKANSLPILTRNTDHFARIADLEVIGYSSGVSA